MFLTKLVKVSHLRAANLLSYHKATKRTTIRAFSASPGNGNDGVSLVQGASRGLGLEFVKQLLSRKEGNVVATCRNPESSQDLQSLATQYGERLSVLPLDVTNEATIASAAENVRQKYGRLDLLVNTAGILHVAGKIKPETGLNRVDPSALLLTYQVNAMGPILVTKHMANLLKLGGGKGTGRPASIIANVSARVSSIQDNGLGGWYSYRASKTALNQLTKTAAVEFARKKDPIISILLHPGTVDTDLSKPFQRNVPPEKLFSPSFSVGKMIDIIDKVGLEDNGKLFAWDGQVIPW